MPFDPCEAPPLDNTPSQATPPEAEPLEVDDKVYGEVVEIASSSPIPPPPLSPPVGYHSPEAYRSSCGPPSPRTPLSPSGYHSSNSTADYNSPPSPVTPEELVYDDPASPERSPALADDDHASSQSERAPSPDGHASSYDDHAPAYSDELLEVDEQVVVVAAGGEPHLAPVPPTPPLHGVDTPPRLLDATPPMSPIVLTGGDEEEPTPASPEYDTDEQIEMCMQEDDEDEVDVAQLGGESAEVNHSPAPTATPFMDDFFTSPPDILMTGDEPKTSAVSTPTPPPPEPLTPSPPELSTPSPAPPVPYRDTAISEASPYLSLQALPPSETQQPEVNPVHPDLVKLEEQPMQRSPFEISPQNAENNINFTPLVSKLFLMIIYSFFSLYF